MITSPILIIQITNDYQFQISIQTITEIIDISIKEEDQKQINQTIKRLLTFPIELRLLWGHSNSW